MQNFLFKLRELLFRLKLYFFGVRFFEREKDVGVPVIFEACYTLLASYTIRLSFRRVECIDFVLRQGQIVGEVYDSYAVRADFSGVIPPLLEHLNGKCFFFNAHTNGFRGNEETILALISDVYLDFIRATEKGQIKSRQ